MTNIDKTEKSKGLLLIFRNKSSENKTNGEFNTVKIYL